MQGTVWEFDSNTCGGRVVLDDGSTLSFSNAVFAASGLRLLRPGQRVRFELDEAHDIRSLTILTLSDPIDTTEDESRSDPSVSRRHSTRGK